MPDWDADSPALRRNLTAVVQKIRGQARRRLLPSLDAIREWHEIAMRGLRVPDPAMVGKFRGERGLEDVEVRIGRHPGAPPAEVAAETSRFEKTLRRTVARLDELIAPGAALGVDELAAVLDVCAWAHAEWVRIHPFANGNGRIARLLANSLALRYGLPMFVRPRPRPDDGYGAAGETAMTGNWQATVPVFRRMLGETLRRAS